MINLFGIANLGRTGILANQRALSVVGNNIANVNTPGYSRRQAVFESLVGGGVRVLGVNRLGDQFLQTRLRTSNSRLGASDVSARNLQLLENALNEQNDSGTSQSIQAFFSSLQDLTGQPSGTPERQSVRAQAQQMLSSLQSSVAQISQLREQIDEQARQQVSKVNDLARALADVNQQIVDRGGSSSDRNHLLDQQDRIIEQLSAILPVQTIEGDSGSLSVMIEGGASLVDGGLVFELAVVTDPSNRGFARIASVGITGSHVIIDDKLGEGSLGALIRSRDTDAAEVLGNLQRLTAEMIRTFNATHRAGTGLDGVTGRDFFSGLGVSGVDALGNVGEGRFSGGTITDEAALTFDDYEIRFTGPGSFDVVNATTGASISTGNSYTSGQPITIEGFTAVISDGASGPAAGDVFSVNSYAGTVERADLTDAIKNDLAAVAAGLSDSAGDNRNAQALAGLRELGLLGSGDSLTFEEYYNSTRTTLGLNVQSAIEQLSDEEISSFQIRELAGAASAVSIDDEAISLVQFQRSFEASSRIISTADAMLQTLLNMV